jgi:hypothetical protein
MSMAQVLKRQGSKALDMEEIFPSMWAKSRAEADFREIKRRQILWIPLSLSESTEKVILSESTTKPK